MSITPKTIATIQKAGTAVHEASQAVEKASQEASGRLMAAMASQPTSGAADKEFARWKSIARVHEEVQDIEARLIDIFNRLQASVEPEIEVLPSIARSANRARIASAQPVQDVVIAPARSRSKTKPKKPRAAQKSKQSGQANEQKMMNFLQTKLNNASPTAVRQREMSDATGIPPGSIGGTLARLVKNGWMVEPSRGTYQLV